MNPLREDVNNPKLQDHYRLQQALLLIKDQDDLLAKTATNEEFLKKVLTNGRITQAKINDLIEQLSRLNHDSLPAYIGFRL